MSSLKSADECLIFYSILLNNKLCNFLDIQSILFERLGPCLSFRHPFCPMKTYYSKEMGGHSEDLSRIMIVSLNCFDRKNLIREKIWSDSFEKSLSLIHSFRVINLDAGYISLENVILSTGKKYAHRIYLESGVYAELTYHFHNFIYSPFEWTYPDYSHADFIDFFTFCRSLLSRKMRK